jgi:hypothetical protein
MQYVLEFDVKKTSKQAETIETAGQMHHLLP